MARFSQRAGFSLTPNRLGRLLAAKREAGRAIVDLTESNPTRVGLAYPGAEILSALANPRALRYEPVPAGLHVAREAIAGYWAGHGHAVDPAQILVTTGTSEAYGLLFKLLCDPGDSILVPRPSYPLLDVLAAAESVGVDGYPLVCDGEWSIDLAALRSAIHPRSRALVLVHPNNPTGSYVKRDELDGLLTLCLEHELALVCDEVFLDYARGSDPRRVSSLIDVASVPTFVLSGLSKVAGLPQMKLGWIGVAGPPAERREALARLEHLNDALLSVGAPVQHAAAELLALAPQIRREIEVRVADNHRTLEQLVEGRAACDLLPAEGGWYDVLRLPAVQTSEECALELLERHDVLVHPGHLYDFEREAYVVLSLLPRPDHFRRGTELLLDTA